MNRSPHRNHSNDNRRSLHGQPPKDSHHRDHFHPHNPRRPARPAQIPREAPQSPPGPANPFRGIQGLGPGEETLQNVKNILAARTEVTSHSVRLGYQHTPLQFSPLPSSQPMSVKSILTPERIRVYERI